MIKKNFLRFLSIVSLVLFVSYPVKSQSTSETNIEIQEINNLRDKFSNLYGQLLLFERYKKNLDISNYYGGLKISIENIIKLDPLIKKLCPEEKEQCHRESLNPEFEPILQQTKELSAIHTVVEKINNNTSINELEKTISQLNSQCLTGELKELTKNQQNQAIQSEVNSDQQNNTEIQTKITDLKKNFLVKCLLENKKNFELTEQFDKLTLDLSLANNKLINEPTKNYQLNYPLLSILCLILLACFLNWRFNKNLELFKKSDEKAKEDLKKSLESSFTLITNNVSHLTEKVGNINSHTQEIPYISKYIEQKLGDTNNPLDIVEEKTVDSTEERTNLLVKIPAKISQSSSENLINEAESLEAQEGSLSEISSSTNDNSQSRPEDPSSITTTTNNQKSKEISNLVASYNKNVKILAKDIIKVNVTKESIESNRSGMENSTIFTKLENGIFFIVKQVQLNDNHYFLVPKDNLNINESHYRTVKNIFECIDYENRSSKKFKLIKPATVKALSDNEWQLMETGELKFETTKNQ